MNKVLLMGKVIKDIDLKSSSTGLSVAKVNMQCFNDGNSKSYVYVTCIFWKDVAENINVKAKKGDKIFVEGRLNLNKSQSKEGNNYYTLEVVGEKFELMSNGEQETNNQNYKPQQTTNYQNYDASDVLTYDDDDIPF